MNDQVEILPGMLVIWYCPVCDKNLEDEELIYLRDEGTEADCLYCKNRTIFKQEEMDEEMRKKFQKECIELQESLNKRLSAG